jgi:hypothetical protein
MKMILNKKLFELEIFIIIYTRPFSKLRMEEATTSEMDEDEMQEVLTVSTEEVIRNSKKH